MLKKLLIILIGSLSIIAFSNIAWASVIGTWEITGKVTTTIKGKGIKTTIIKGALDGDSWIFNEDNSFDSDNVGGTWSQVKTKFAVNFNDDDIISLAEEMLSEEFGTDITVNAITKKTFTGTENTKKNTIKGSFKIYMTASGYDESCGCERTGKVTVAGSFNGTLSGGGETVCPKITLSPSSLPVATKGTVFNQTITASGGKSPYIFTANGLPAWLTLSSSGVLSGTPTTSGTVSFFSVTATDANNCSSSPQMYAIGTSS